MFAKRQGFFRYTASKAAVPVIVATALHLLINFKLEISGLTKTTLGILIKLLIYNSP